MEKIIHRVSKIGIDDEQQLIDEEEETKDSGNNSTFDHQSSIDALSQLRLQELLSKLDSPTNFDEIYEKLLNDHEKRCFQKFLDEMTQNQTKCAEILGEWVPWWEEKDKPANLDIIELDVKEQGEKTYQKNLNQYLRYKSFEG